MTWAAWEPLYNVENGSSPSHTSYTIAGWGPNRSKPDKRPMSIFAFLIERELLYIICEIMRYWLAKNDKLFYPHIFIENWSDGLLYFSFLPVTTFFIQRGLKA